MHTPQFSIVENIARVKTEMREQCWFDRISIPGQAFLIKKIFS